MPQPFRCGAGMGHYLSSRRHRLWFICADDVKLSIRSLGEREDLFKEGHISSTKKCGQSKLCTANLQAQIGPKATWIQNGTGEIAWKLYKSCLGHDLAKVV